MRCIEPDTAVIIFEGLIGERMLALRLRTSAIWSASPLMFFGSLKSGHLKRTIIKEQSRRTHTDKKNTKHKQRASLGPTFPAEKRKKTITAAIQSGAFSPFPPGSKCLFSSLVFLCLRFAIAVLTARVSTRSVVGEVCFSRFGATPAVKKPSAVVRPVYHVPSFGGHYCPGISRPVPADGDSSSPRSGSILPSLFSKLTHTSGDGSGVCGLGLQYFTVSTGVTVTCAASRPRFFSSRFSMASSSSLTLTCSIALIRLLTSKLHPLTLANRTTNQRRILPEWVGANEDHETNRPRRPQLDQNCSSSSRSLASLVLGGLSFPGDGELQRFPLRCLNCTNGWMSLQLHQALSSALRLNISLFQPHQSGTSFLLTFLRRASHPSWRRFHSCTRRPQRRL